MTKSQKGWEKRYYKAVSTLDDDTGYFDHDFVLNFISTERNRLLDEVMEVVGRFKNNLVTQELNDEFDDLLSTLEKLKENK